MYDILDFDVFNFFLAGAFACHVFLNDRLCVSDKVFGCKQAIVGFFVEVQSSFIQPVDDVSALLISDPLVHHDFAFAFHIGTVSADHAVKADVPDLFLVFCFGASGHQIDFVAIGPKLPYRFNSGDRQVAVVVIERAIDIGKDDLWSAVI